ncbi:MAG: IPTL-CTERM sorting domain-containing protein [Xanthomonadales bacterium]|nr:IPTL-CTERM sorting domain-containing protein [Xanthomonadales bacterium]
MRRAPALLSLLLPLAALAQDRSDGSHVGAIPPAPPRAPDAVLLEFDLGASNATQAGRMNRDGNPSSCAAPKAYPGTFATLNYRRVTSLPLYNNSTLAQCATIVVTPAPDCDINVFASAYLGSFDPASIAANYLGDSGLSFGLPVSDPLVFAVNVPAGGRIVVNLNDSNSPDLGGSCRLTVASNELDFAPLNPVAAPALNARALGLLALLLAALGVLTVRRRG